MDLFICRFCGSQRKNNNSLRNHERTCPHNSNRNYKNGMKGKKGTNQYIRAKELGIEVPTSKTKGQPRPNWKPHSEETKKKLSEIAINRGFGGVTQSRWIKYKGKTLGSSYELTLAKNLDYNNIKWDVCKKFDYVDPFGKKRTYTPDFYLCEYDVYLDPKNDFLINNINPSLGFSDLEKIKLVEEYNQIKILVLDKTQLSWDYIKNILGPRSIAGDAPDL